MERPKLTKIDHRKFFRISKGKITITMNRDQWDTLLDVAYKRGHVLLELDENENLIAAYKKKFGEKVKNGNPSETKKNQSWQN